MLVKYELFEPFNYALMELCKVKDLPRIISNKITDFMLKQWEVEYNIFTKERIKICEIYCDRDESGNPIVENKNYKFVAKATEYNTEMQAFLAIEKDVTWEAINEAETGKDPIPTTVLIILKKIGFVV